jgi:hypothetical protein
MLRDLVRPPWPRHRLYSIAVEFSEVLWEVAPIQAPENSCLDGPRWLILHDRVGLDAMRVSRNMS